MRRDHFHLALPSDRMEDPTKPSSSSGDSDGTATPRRISSEKGTLPWMHPTHAHININGQKLEWSSRDHRKGRHPVESGARRKIVNFLRLEWWNVSWWVAFVESFYNLANDSGLRWGLRYGLLMGFWCFYLC